MMRDIVKVHFPDLENRMVEAAMEKFYAIRSRPNLQKKPSTSELIDWLHALLAMGIDHKAFKDDDPLIGCLLKKEQDLAQPNSSKVRYL